MPMNRVQCQPGLSLPEFLHTYGTEAACEQALAQARWPAGFVCPRCAGANAHRFQRFGQAYWQCRAQTSLRAGTVFASSKLPLTTWFLALYLISQSKNAIAALELRRHLGVCYRSAWRIKHKLMQAMTGREAGRQLAGVVQVDDAYLGGERTGGKAGRGSENKRPFLIAVATDEAGHPRQAVIEPVPAFTKAALADWAAAPPGAGRRRLQRWPGRVSGRRRPEPCPYRDPGPAGQGRHRGRRRSLGQRRAGQPQALPGRYLSCVWLLQIR